MKNKKLKTFKEYLDNKSKLQTKPIIDINGDTSQNPPVKPPKAVTKGKNWESPSPSSNNPNPYVGTGIKDAKKNIDKGLGILGDKNLIYEPDTIDFDGDPQNDDNFSFPKEKTSSVWATKSESFIEKTKNFSNKNFIDYVENELKINNIESIPTIYAEKKGNFIPDPIQSIKYIGYVTNENEKYMESLVMEIKRKNGLDKLIKHILEHGEAYKAIAEYLTNENKGLLNSRRLAQELNEVTGPPERKIHLSKKRRKVKPKPQNTNNQEDETMPNPQDNELELNQDNETTNKVENTIIKALKEKNLI